MANDATFDPVRAWCHTKYTGAKGQAMLVSGTKDQWRTIRGDEPLTFRNLMAFNEMQHQLFNYLRHSRDEEDWRIEDFINGICQKAKTSGIEGISAGR